MMVEGGGSVGEALNNFSCSDILIARVSQSSRVYPPTQFATRLSREFKI